MQIALLNVSYCRLTSEKGVVSVGQRIVERHELGEKVGKNTVLKIHRTHNLEKLNDAKCTIDARFFAQRAFEKQEKVGVLQVLKR